MDKAHVVFGSSTGMTEAVAARIAADLGTDAINVATADASAFDAEMLVLGTSLSGSTRRTNRTRPKSASRT